MRYKFEISDAKMKGFLQDANVADPKDQERINTQEQSGGLVHD